MAFTSQLGIAASQLANIELGVVSGASSGIPDNFYQPEVRFGPPMRGAPWAVRLFIQPRTPPPPPAPPAPAATPNLYATEIRFGPPMRGAPWAVRLFVQPSFSQSPAGPGSGNQTGTGRGLPFLQRIPDLHGPSSEDRHRRFTELLSICFNSLVRQGILVQTGPTDFTINAAALSGADTDVGLTGTFNTPDSFHV